MAIFFGLTLCALLARWPLRRMAMVAMLVGYAAITEALQAFIPYRQSDWLDLAENLAGLALGIAVYAVVSRLTPGEGVKPLDCSPDRDQ